MNFWREVSIFERGLILETLGECKWNRSETARQLQMPRSTLNIKIRELGIERSKSIQNGSSMKSCGVRLP